VTNAVIAFANSVDQGALSGGAWVSGLPLTNLQDRVLGKVARSANVFTSSTQFLADIGPDMPARVIGLVAHTLSLSASVRIRASNDNTFATTLFDSGWQDAWPAVYDTVSLEWQALNWWSGKYLDRQRQGYTWNYILDIGQSINAEYWLVEIDDTGNPAHFVQLGRLFIGDAWQFTCNMQYGSTSLAWEDGSAVQESRSGAESFDKRAKFRVVRFTTNFMQIDEAMSEAFDIQRQAGITEEVIFMYDPADTLHRLRRQFMGRIRTLSPIEYPTLAGMSTPWEIKELL
jgi:hypothetical protein